MTTWQQDLATALAEQIAAGRMTRHVANIILSDLDIAPLPATFVVEVRRRGPYGNVGDPLHTERIVANDDVEAVEAVKGTMCLDTQVCVSFGTGPVAEQVPVRFEVDPDDLYAFVAREAV